MTAWECGEQTARAARRTGIVEIRALIAGIEATGSTRALLVELPAAVHALARLERAEADDVQPEKREAA